MLGNYKIRVNNESESKEAQWLFFELGYRIGACTMKGFPYLIVTQKDYSSKCSDLNSFKRHKELTLSKLKDMVVLHRNDVNDATHVGNYCGHFYVTCDGDIYSWEGQGVWEENNYNTMNDIKPIQTKPVKQGLISGADALRALADGKEVEVYMEIPNKLPKTKGWVDASICSLVAFAFISPSLSFKFRLKPRTITLNVEIPAPFKPKVGEFAFYLDGSCKDGFDFYQYDGIDLGNPLWRSSEEIKQVVSALRKGIKGVDNV
jgi:hypothetical protein